jgi:hypothetical protein
MEGGAMSIHCGDCVRDRGDPRHVGVVEAVIGGQYKVRWDDNKWVTWYDGHERLEKLTIPERDERDVELFGEVRWRRVLTVPIPSPPPPPMQRKRQQRRRKR